MWLAYNGPDLQTTREDASNALQGQHQLREILHTPYD